MLEKQRGGIVDFPDPSKSLTDITKIKFRQANTGGHFYQITSGEGWCACTTNTLCSVTNCLRVLPRHVWPTRGPGICRQVCPGAVILYFQQISFVWADRDYTNYSPYRTEAIANPTQWIFVLEKQRGGIEDSQTPANP